MPTQKTVLVTGATDGIGRATAGGLLERGWRVLVHGRNADKAGRTANELANPAAIPVWGDLSNMTAVVELADQVRVQCKSLDALVNNAGVYSKKRSVSADGFELTMAVNHFAPFLLTHHLLPSLQATKKARVVNVSSMTHSGAQLDLNDIHFEKHWDAYAVYAASKLANILFTSQLARDLRKTGITVNALHPGVVGTKLLRAGFSMGGLSHEDGARTSIYLTDAADASKHSGEYFVDCRPARADGNPRQAQALWQKSATLLRDFL